MDHGAPAHGFYTYAAALGRYEHSARPVYLQGARFSPGRVLGAKQRRARTCAQQAHGGHGYAAADRRALVAAARDEHLVTVGFARRLRESGVPVRKKLLLIRKLRFIH